MFRIFHGNFKSHTWQKYMQIEIWKTQHIPDCVSCSSFGLLCFWHKKKKSQLHFVKTLGHLNGTMSLSHSSSHYLFVHSIFNTESNTIEIETEILLLCIYCSAKLTYREYGYWILITVFVQHCRIGWASSKLTLHLQAIFRSSSSLELLYVAQVVA